MNHSDVLFVLQDDQSDDNSIVNIIDYSKEKQRPLISVSMNRITIERGDGLNAGAITGLEAFNSFPVNIKERENYIENIYQGLFAESVGVDENAKHKVRKYLLPFYVRASKLAKKNQKTYQHAGFFVYSFSAIAVGAVALGTLVHKLSPWAFGLELLLMLTILITVLVADKNRTHRKWIENRFLAESLGRRNF